MGQGLLFLKLIMKEVISFDLDHYFITFTNQLEMEEPSILMISTFNLLKFLTHIGMLSLVTKAIYNNGGSFHLMNQNVQFLKPFPFSKSSECEVMIYERLNLGFDVQVASLKVQSFKAFSFALLEVWNATMIMYKMLQLCL